MREDTKGSGVAHDTTCVVVPRSNLGWGGSRRPCGKPAKGVLRSGEPVCGLHLAAEKRADANDARWKAEAAEAADRRREAAAVCADIKRRCPTLEPSPYSPPYGPLHGSPNPEYVVVRVNALRVLLDIAGGTK